MVVVLQGTDTSGKGDTVRSVGDLLDPQGIVVRAFGRPTEEEQRHTGPPAAYTRDSRDAQ